MTPLPRIRSGVNGHVVIFCDDIVRVDVTDIEKLELHVVTGDGTRSTSYGIHALEAAMRLCPEALESRRMRWYKHTWSIHNLVGHPVMQVLSFFGFYKTAFWFHDVTVPTPKP